MTVHGTFLSVMTLEQASIASNLLLFSDFTTFDGGFNTCENYCEVISG
jgi:hypothetical protein